jgi:putative hemolysin
MHPVQPETDRKIGPEDFISPSSTSAYSVRISTNDGDVAAAQRLRYRVFNLELGEGLESSEASGHDVDRFDAVCDHLLVEFVSTGAIIGTYRLQTGENARANLGYYSEQEFDFNPFEPIRSQTIELGRACIAKEHRNMVALGLLWKGIAQYSKIHGSRYLIGCSSYTETDPAVGLAAYEALAKYRVEDSFLTKPNPGYVCRVEDPREIEEVDPKAVKAPRLMRAYLTLGARLCGEPALDREFKTIDFLTLLDLEKLGPRAMRKFLG